MLVLYKNQANELTVTVSENVTLSSPYFLWEFINNGTSTCCIAPNTSTATSRYDTFTITEVENPDQVDAEIELNTGDYLYKVYEQSSASNLIPANANKLLETSTARVLDEQEEDVEYNGGDLTDLEYGG